MVAADHHDGDDRRNAETKQYGRRGALRMKAPHLN